MSATRRPTNSTGVQKAAENALSGYLRKRERGKNSGDLQRGGGINARTNEDRKINFDKQVAWRKPYGKKKSAGSGRVLRHSA